MMKSLRYFISTILQYIVAFYEYIQQFLQKHFTGKVITFDTGKRVIVGKQIAEGGFSYIFLAYDSGSTSAAGRGYRSTTTSSTKSRSGTTAQQQPRQTHPQRTYALKRIYCPDTELMDRCRYEADVHRDVMNQNCHIMPLYGFTIIQLDCYMLFPLCTESLRDMINRKNPFLQPTVFDPSTHTHGTTATSTTTTTAIPRITTTMAPPITEVMVLQLFLQICRGVQALHTCGYSHRDIKIENVMIASSSSSSSWQPSKSKFQSNSPSLQQTQQQPVPHLLLMDFGSAGPIEMTIHHRKQILQIVELASQHTTMPYRPPELLEGGIRWHPTNNTTTATTLTTTAVGNNTNTITNTNTPTNNTNTMILDYSAVDVWSLGCTLHAIMYGASPFECEFNIASSNVTSRHYTTTSVSANSTSTIGNIKIVDCTHLSILGNIPVPKHLPISSWYSASIRNDLLLPMLRQEPQQRPKLPTIIQTIEQMIVQLGGSVISDMPSLVESDSANTNNFFYETEHRPYRDNVNNDNNDDADADADGIALLNRMA